MIFCSFSGLFFSLSQAFRPPRCLSDGSAARIVSCCFHSVSSCTMRSPGCRLRWTSWGFVPSLGEHGYDMGMPCIHGGEWRGKTWQYTTIQIIQNICVSIIIHCIRYVYIYICMYMDVLYVYDGRIAWMCDSSMFCS